MSNGFLVGLVAKPLRARYTSSRFQRRPIHQKGNVMWYMVLWMMLIGLCGNVSVVEAVSEKQRRTLKGLPGVYVHIEPIGSIAQKDGLTESAVQTAVERILRSKGVPILTREQRAMSSSAPTLYVQVNSLRSNSHPFYAVTVEVSLHQWVSLLHTPRSKKADASTWNILSTGIYPQSNLRSLIPDAIEPLIKQFANDYLTVHPSISKEQKSNPGESSRPISVVEPDPLFDALMEMPQQ